jgi:hypothetical protein
MPLIPVNVNWCFGGTYHLHLKGQRVIQAKNQHEAGSKQRKPCVKRSGSTQARRNLKPISLSALALPEKNVLTSSYLDKCCILASYCVKDNAFIHILFHLHNSFWYKYTTRIFLTTCFGLMGPSSGVFRLLYNHLLFATLPHTGQCSHIGNALYVFFLFTLFCQVYCDVHAVGLFWVSKGCYLVMARQATMGTVVFSAVQSQSSEEVGLEWELRVSRREPAVAASEYVPAGE